MIISKFTFLTSIILLAVMASNSHSSPQAVSLDAQIVKTISDQVSSALKLLMEESGLLNLPSQVLNIKTELAEMGNSINFMQDSCTEAVSKAMWAENKILSLENQISNLERELDYEREARLRIETELRKANVKIWGITSEAEAGVPFHNYVSTILGKAIQSECVVTSAFRLGRKLTKEYLSSPIIATIPDTQMRYKLLSSHKELSKHGLKIREDLPSVLDDRIKQVMPCFLAAKRKGLPAKLKRDVILLHGKKYNYNSLNILPEGTRPLDLSKRENRNTYLFWGKANPLSNFHTQPNMITEGDMSFCSVEQYLQAAKAKLFDDDEALQHIMAVNDPLTIKKTRVSNYDSKIWLESAPTIMKCALQMKFSQNRHLADFLTSTGSKCLAEASPQDTFWGTGIATKEPSCFDRDRWGKNMLGILLMEVRDELKK